MQALPLTQLQFWVRLLTSQRVDYFTRERRDLGGGMPLVLGVYVIGVQPSVGIELVDANCIRLGV
jgi:hypothetical protein